MSETHTRVVVVGGGLAGIAAALTVLDAAPSRSVEVTLVERRSRLGGATWSFERNGVWFDNGQHVFLRCCTEYRALLERLGVADRVVLQDRLAVPVIAAGGSCSWLRRGPGPAPWHLAGSLLGYRHLSLRERWRAARAMRALARVDRDAPHADAVTFADWLRDHGQSDRAIRRLWDVITRPTVNLPAAEASLGAAAMVFQTALLADATAGDLGWSRVPLRQLHADAGRVALERAGATVRTGTAIEGIDLEGGAVRAVRVGGEPIAADVVVLAVPHDVAATLLPEGALTPDVGLDALGASPIVNVQVVYDRRVTELTVAAGVDTPVEWVFDRTEAAGLDAGQCLAVSMSAADAQVGLPPEELIATYTEALGELLPGARTARVLDAVVTREHEATWRAAPGARAHRPGPRTTVDGLTLAGAWTDTGWPATMEGAVRSGRTAADLVLDRLGGSGHGTSAAPGAGRMEVVR